VHNFVDKYDIKMVSWYQKFGGIQIIPYGLMGYNWHMDIVSSFPIWAVIFSILTGIWFAVNRVIYRVYVAKKHEEFRDIPRIQKKYNIWLERYYPNYFHMDISKAPNHGIVLYFVIKKFLKVPLNKI